MTNNFPRIILAGLLSLMSPQADRFQIIQEKIILDSDLSFEEAVSGIEIPQNIIADLVLIYVKYIGFDGHTHVGQLLTGRRYSEELYDIFKELYELKFPIYSVIPISSFGWSDDSSMAANNTSSFNYRSITGTKLISMHAFGRAVDINPLLNPRIRMGNFYPSDAEYNPSIPGTLTGHSPAVASFKKRGWRWGGNWMNNKDYQHFEK